LEEPGEHRFDAIGQLIERECLREPWSKALCSARAEYLSHWLVPHLMGTRILDLLCGDGAVGVLLEAASGKRVCLVERSIHRGGVDRTWSGRIQELDTLTPGGRPAECDSVLLCTVLHHEEDPLWLLSLAVRSATRRVVIVENCIEPEFGAAYQMAIDHIFNLSLSRTALPCPGQHRSAEEWVAICAKFGGARVVDRRTDVPGVPLAHTLIVLDFEAAP
jgi:hypothetical protein